MKKEQDYKLEIEGAEYELQKPVFDLIKAISLERDDLRREKELYNSLEAKTDRNTNVVSAFMEHCKENGIEIKDELFESYFNA